MTATHEPAGSVDAAAPHPVAGVYHSQHDMVGVYRCRACQRWVVRVSSSRRGWQHTDPALNPPLKRRMGGAFAILGRWADPLSRKASRSPDALG